MTWIKCPEDNFDRCLAVEFEEETDIGGFQLLDLVITELKSHMTC